ncbi:MAG: hypothetical protein KGS48_18910, partial [Bacteroidetes bacterium]|nr:hypothetical protein [Bacteroidota bacterium]
ETKNHPPGGAYCHTIAVKVYFILKSIYFYYSISSHTTYVLACNKRPGKVLGILNLALRVFVKTI